MNERKALLDRLLNETELLKNALEANALDVVETVIEQRQQTIDGLALLDNSALSKDEKALLERFQELERSCEALLKQWREDEEREWHKFKIKKRELSQNKKAFNQYSGQAVLQNQGYRFDDKK